MRRTGGITSAQHLQANRVQNTCKTGAYSDARNSYLSGM